MEHSNFGLNAKAREDMQPEGPRMFAPAGLSGGAMSVLKASGVEQGAKRVGDLVPDVAVRDEKGRAMRLSDLWRKGPLVVVFYRGAWCPHGNGHLRGWQRRIGDVERLGGSIVAISPETTGHLKATTMRNGLTFPVVSDSDLEAAGGFGVAFTVAPELVDLYTGESGEVPVLNGSGQWVLPVPATFVVDGDGRIQFAQVDAELQGGEPGEAIKAIESMTALA